MQEKHKDQLSSPSEVIIILNRTEKHDKKKQGKIQHEMPRTKYTKNCNEQDVQED